MITGGQFSVVISILDATGVPCTKTDTGFQWKEVRPRQVRIRWQGDARMMELSIPVIDQYGRIAATELPAIDIEEALWQLAEFPLPPDEEGGNNDEGESLENPGGKNSKGSLVPTGSYPIRQMMELVESIAAKQTEVAEADWPHWCQRLEQVLGQAGDSTPVKYFRDDLKLNPLSPLRHKPFRPSFAENCDSESGKLYTETLKRIEKGWGVCLLHPLEGAQ